MAKMRSMGTGRGSLLSAIVVSMCLALAFGVFPSAVNADATRSLSITGDNISNLPNTKTEGISKYNCDGNPDWVTEIRITFGPIQMETDIEVINGPDFEAQYILNYVQHTALKMEIPAPVPIVLEASPLPNVTGQDYCIPDPCGGPSPAGNFIRNLAPSGTVNEPNILVTNQGALAQIVLHPGDPNFDFFVGPPAETFNLELTTSAVINEVRPGTSGGDNVTEANGTGTIQYFCTVPEPGLQCTKSFNKGIVDPGDVILATATITNTGDVEITADVTDTLEAGLSYVGMVEGPTPDSVVGGVITWLGASLGPIPVGATITFKYNVSVDTIAPLQTLCNDFIGKSTDYPGIETEHCIACVTREEREVPAFTQWGIIGFTLILSISALWLIRRRRSMS